MKTAGGTGLIGTRPKVYWDWRIALGLGGPPKVDSAGEAELCAAVEQDPRAAGYPFSVWTGADLIYHLVSRGFVSVSAETIRQHLHNLSYRLVRPVLSINSPDPSYATQEEQLARYREQARRREIILL